MLASPRKKQVSCEELDLRHRLATDKVMKHTLSDSPFSYVWWYEELMEHIVKTPYHNMVMMQLPPLECSDEYKQQFMQRIGDCAANPEGNAYLNSLLISSTDSSMKHYLRYPMACENIEAVKAHFAGAMDPFRFLIFENTLSFDRYDFLSFHRLLDTMSKLYYHVFRKAPSKELVVQWMMNSLTNDFLANGTVLHKIQLDWANLHNNPEAILRIINSCLQHRRQRSPQVS